MTVIDIPKNKRETLRVARENYQGHDLVNLRVFFEADDGELRPSRKGVAFNAGLLPEVLSARQSRSVMTETGAGE